MQKAINKIHQLENLVFLFSPVCSHGGKEAESGWERKKQERKDEGKELKFIVFSDSMEASNYRIEILFSDADTLSFNSLQKSRVLVLQCLIYLLLKHFNF